MKYGYKCKNKQTNYTACLSYLSTNIAFNGEDRAILYLLNACAYIMHVIFNGGKSFTVILEDQENGIISHDEM